MNNPQEQVNCKQELLDLCEGRGPLLAAMLMYTPEGGCAPMQCFELYEGYSLPEFEAFLESLDFTYDCGYGGQELAGTVWFPDSWCTRQEYDGKEWWEIHERPSIPTRQQIALSKMKELLKRNILHHKRKMSDDDNPGWYGEFSLCGPTSGHLAEGNPDMCILNVLGVHVLTHSKIVVEACLELHGTWYHKPQEEDERFDTGAL